VGILLTETDAMLVFGFGQQAIFVDVAPPKFRDQGILRVIDFSGWFFFSRLRQTSRWFKSNEQSGYQKSGIHRRNQEL
jgi:hypothetical protein